jgi:hypothetical protein
MNGHTGGRRAAVQTFESPHQRRALMQPLVAAAPARQSGDPDAHALLNATALPTAKHLFGNDLRNQLLGWMSWNSARELANAGKSLTVPLMSVRAPDRRICGR